MTDRIVDEFQRILTLMDRVAPDGLVLDIRGNPGGNVQAAERMLQMLTPGTIVPQQFHLANTPAMLQILRNLRDAAAHERQLSPDDDTRLTDARVELGPWLDDADNQPLPEGERLTNGKTLTAFCDANDIGQVYQGRTALLVDGLTYSAADIFAAGFQDHGIGRILGTDAPTGGGGANVWSHNELLQKLGPTPGIALAPLPRDTGMSLAIRRSSRVGFFQGQPVEDVGVAVDDRFRPASAEDVSPRISEPHSQGVRVPGFIAHLPPRCREDRCAEGWQRCRRTRNQKRQLAAVLFGCPPRVDGGCRWSALHRARSGREFEPFRAADQGLSRGGRGDWDGHASGRGPHGFLGGSSARDGCGHP